MGKNLDKASIIYLYKRKNPTAKIGLFQKIGKIFSPRPESLFLDIIRWVVAALVIYTILGSVYAAPQAPPEGLVQWLKRLVNIWLIRPQGEPLDIIKTALTLVGGIGAIAYLVIRFRERTDQEAERREKEKAAIEERFNKAIEQLGDSSPQVRIAGVYALTDVADTYLGHYQQRTVDILCGYLRTKRVDEKGEFNDASVESTILKVIREHLLDDRNEKIKSPVQVKQTEQLWVQCTFDLHAAEINEAFIFENCTFSSSDFKDAKFISKCRFNRSTFKGLIEFNRAGFECKAFFDGAIFGYRVIFWDSNFENGVSFQNATLGKGAYFVGAIFNSANFDNSSFTGLSYFGEAQFDKKVTFNNTRTADMKMLDAADFYGETEINLIEISK